MNTTNAVARALRAMAVIARTPVSPSCIAAAYGALPTGQSAAAKHPPIRRLGQSAPESEAGDHTLGSGLYAGAALVSAEAGVA